MLVFGFLCVAILTMIGVYKGLNPKYTFTAFILFLLFYSFLNVLWGLFSTVQCTVLEIMTFDRIDCNPAIVTLLYSLFFISLIRGCVEFMKSR